MTTEIEITDASERMEDIFARATRERLRFPSDLGVMGGLLTVEDLWTLPLSSTRGTSLGAIGAALLHDQEFHGKSILKKSKPSKEKIAVDLAVEVVRHIVAVREAEAEEKTNAAAKASERARLDALIQQKETDGASLEDLKKARKALG